MSAFTKKGDPILKSGQKWKAPGHNSIVKVGNSEYAVYHAYNGVAGVGERDALVDKVIWQNGWPIIGKGTPSETEQYYPQ